MRLLLRILLALSISGAFVATPSAVAQTITEVGGNQHLTLSSAKTTTGASANAGNVLVAAQSAVFTYVTTAGTATVKAQLSCDNGSNWIDVVSSTKDLDILGTAADGVGIDNPQCAYRTNITACSSCSVTTTLYVGSRVK